MKNKGFTLVELIVSIVLVTFISVFFYYLIINFKNKLNMVNAESEILVYQATIMKLIYEDFSKDKLTQVQASENTITYTYESATTKILQVDINNKTLIYDGISYPVPTSCNVSSPSNNSINDTEKITPYKKIISTKITLECEPINKDIVINIVGIY